MIKILIFVLFLTGCSQQNTSQEDFQEDIYLDSLYDDYGNEIAAFDTYLSMTSYQEGAFELYYDKIYEQIETMHKQIDPNNLFNEYEYNLAYINSNNEITDLKIDETLFQLFSLSLEISELSDGYYNPTIISLYNVYQSLFSVYPIERTSPDESKITQAMQCVIPYQELEDYILLDDENQSISILPYPGCEQLTFHFGAIAKGYALDAITSIFMENELAFMFNFGKSSISAQGYDSGKNEWSIGFSKPFEFIQSYYYLTLEDGFTLSTSATDGRYYIDDETGEIIHHILNPHTAESLNIYQSITLVSDKNNAVLDALSTILFNLEIDEAIQMIHRFEVYFDMDISYLFYANADGETIYLSKDLKDNLTILDDYQDEIELIYMED